MDLDATLKWMFTSTDTTSTGHYTNDGRTVQTHHQAPTFMQNGITPVSGDYTTTSAFFGVTSPMVRKQIFPNPNNVFRRSRPYLANTTMRNLPLDGNIQGVYNARTQPHNPLQSRMTRPPLMNSSTETQYYQPKSTTWRSAVGNHMINPYVQIPSSYVAQGQLQTMASASSLIGSSSITPSNASIRPSCAQQAVCTNHSSSIVNDLDLISQIVSDDLQQSNTARKDAIPFSQQGSSGSSHQNVPERIWLLVKLPYPSTRIVTNGGAGIQLTLLCAELWRKLFLIGNEMLLSLAGEPFFPVLLFRLSGLEAEKAYTVCVEFFPLHDGEPSHLYNVYKSAVYGAELMSSVITCSTLQLTLHGAGKSDKIGLHLHHKYVLNVVIACGPVHTCVRLSDTEFLTVTSYKNREIRSIKRRNKPLLDCQKHAYTETGLGHVQSVVTDIQQLHDNTPVDI